MAPSISFFFASILQPISLFPEWPSSNLLEKRLEKKRLFYFLKWAKSSPRPKYRSTPSVRKKIFKGNRKLLGHWQVKQVMQSRMDITAIDVEDDLPWLMESESIKWLIQNPCFEETIDNILGILLHQRLNYHFIEKDWRILLGKNWSERVFFVPENKIKWIHLLKDFSAKARFIWAIVVDESWWDVWN